MTLTFPIPRRDIHRFTRPKSYLGNILGHEGEGSLLSALKVTGWVDSLSAGGGVNNRDAASFDVSVGLTPTGVDHVDEIIAEIFRAINMVRDSGLPKWLFDENQQLSDLAFRFQQKSAPRSVTRSLSVRAQDWPAEKLLAGPYRRSKFDTEGIREILDHLQPENLYLVVVAPDLETNLKTKWYDAPYSVQPIPTATVTRWRDAGLNPAIRLPKPNPFVPRDVALKKDEPGDPVQLVGTPKLDLWHRTDSSFRVPHANFNANIHTPVVNESARSLVLSILYSQMVNEQLNEFSYPAALAGLSYDFFTNRRGLGLRLSGYADGQVQMLENVVDAMMNPDYDEELFERLRKELIERISNVSKNAPYEQTSAEIRRLLMVPYFGGGARKRALRKLKIADLKSFVPRLYQKVHVSALSHGNVSRDDTNARLAVLKRAFLDKAEAVHVGRTLVVRLPEQSRYAKRMKVKHNDSALSIYVQGDQRNRDSRARFALLRQMLSQPFYAELRTRRQLGYFVFTYGMDIMRVPAVVLALQSPSTGPGELALAVEDFLADFEKQVAQMSDEEFERHRQALITRVEEEDKRLSDRTSLYWNAVLREDRVFDGPKRFADALREVDKSEILALYRKLFVQANAGRIAVYTEGKEAKDQNPEVFNKMQRIKSRNRFKKDKALHPPLSEVQGYVD